jgi:hypothetical protein
MPCVALDGNAVVQIAVTGLAGPHRDDDILEVRAPRGRESSCIRGGGRRDLVGDHLEARERARAERGHDRDVGGIAPACHKDATDARHVVPWVEGIPAKPP